MPPALLRCGLGFRCFLIVLTPSTRTRSLSESTRSTRPFLPLSLPARTITWSLRLIFAISSIPSFWPRRSNNLAEPESALEKLNNFRCQRNDLQKFLLTQLAGNRTKHARANRLHRIVDHNRRVLVEADVCTVTTAILLARADNHRLDDLALLHRSIGRSFLHRRRDHVTEAGLLAESAAQRQDHLQLACAGVVGDIQHGAHLNCHRESPYSAQASSPRESFNHGRVNSRGHSSY